MVDSQEVSLFSNEEDKRLFLKTLNKKGFLLEDKTWKIITESLKDKIIFLERNKPYNPDGTEGEIDFIVVKKHFHFIIECKKTESIWLFSKALERTNILNLIMGTSEELKILNQITTLDTSSFEISFLLNDEGKLIPKISDGVKQFKEPAQEIHKHIRQVLRETEAYLYDPVFDNENIQTIIPVIVTNAKLYFLSYTKGNIDSRGDLIDYNKIDEAPWIIYNHPQILKWGKNKEIIPDSNGNENSIFIVNIGALDRFLKEFEETINVKEFYIKYTRESSDN